MAYNNLLFVSRLVIPNPLSLALAAPWLGRSNVLFLQPRVCPEEMNIAIVAV